MARRSSDILDQYWPNTGDSSGLPQHSESSDGSDEANSTGCEDPRDYSDATSLSRVVSHSQVANPQAMPVWRMRVQRGAGPSIVDFLSTLCVFGPGSPGYMALCFCPTHVSRWVYVITTNFRSSYWQDIVTSISGVVKKQGQPDIYLVPDEERHAVLEGPATESRYTVGDWVKVVRHPVHYADIAVVVEPDRPLKVALLARPIDMYNSLGQHLPRRTRPPQTLLPLLPESDFPSDLTTILLDEGNIQFASRIDYESNRLFHLSQDATVIGYPPWHILRPSEWTFTLGESVDVLSTPGVVVQDDGVNVVVTNTTTQEDVLQRWDSVFKTFQPGDNVNVHGGRLNGAFGQVVYVHGHLADIVLNQDVPPIDTAVEHVSKMYVTAEAEPNFKDYHDYQGFPPTRGDCSKPSAQEWWMITVHRNRLSRLPHLDLPAVNQIHVMDAPYIPPPTRPRPPYVATSQPLSLGADVVVTSGPHKGWHAQVLDNLSDCRVLIRLNKYGLTSQFEQMIVPRVGVEPCDPLANRLPYEEAIPRTPSPAFGDHFACSPAWDPLDSTASMLVAQPPETGITSNVRTDKLYRWLFEPCMQDVTFRATYRMQDNIPIRCIVSQGVPTLTRRLRSKDVPVDINELSFEHPGSRQRGRFLIIRGHHIGHHARPIQWQVASIGSKHIQWTVQLVRPSRDDSKDEDMHTQVQLLDTDMVLGFESKKSQRANHQFATELRRF